MDRQSKDRRRGLRRGQPSRETALKTVPRSYLQLIAQNLSNERSASSETLDG